MSFDVFFQGFRAGEPSKHGGNQMRQALMPHVIEQQGSFLRLRVGDGEADVYLREDGMMANHISGQAPWHVLLSGAQAANWVIMPMDCPTCLTRPGQQEELPEELDDDVVFVETAAELLALIESRCSRHVR